MWHMNYKRINVSTFELNHSPFTSYKAMLFDYMAIHTITMRAILSGVISNSTNIFTLTRFILPLSPTADTIVTQVKGHWLHIRLLTLGAI